MDQTLVVVLRFVERILIDLGGAMAAYLGFQLFLRMPSRERSEGKFELPGGISIYVSRVGPGIFFALFGTAILGLSMMYGVSQDVTRNEITASPSGNPASVAAGQIVVSSHYSGAATPAEEIDPARAKARRASVSEVILNLNRVPGALRADLSSGQTIDIESAIHESKVRLLESVWDDAEWGQFAQFHDWVDRGETMPPPPGVAKIARIYLAGSPGQQP